jgi:hypothetical protein
MANGRHALARPDTKPCNTWSLCSFSLAQLGRACRDDTTYLDDHSPHMSVADRQPWTRHSTPLSPFPHTHTQSTRPRPSHTITSVARTSPLSSFSKTTNYPATATQARGQDTSHLSHHSSKTTYIPARPLTRVAPEFGTRHHKEFFPVV